MYYYGRKSRAVLASLCEDLQDTLNIVIRHVNITLIDGARGEARQNQYLREGASRASFGESPHNWLCSCCPKSPGALAVDAVPYPLPPWLSKDPKDVAETSKRFNEMLLVVSAVSDALGVKLDLGRDFSFNDMPHIEKSNWPLFKNRLISADWRDNY